MLMRETAVLCVDYLDDKKNKLDAEQSKEIDSFLKSIETEFDTKLFSFNGWDDWIRDIKLKAKLLNEEKNRSFNNVPSENQSVPNIDLEKVNEGK